jgi:hypothetical protein
MFGGLFYLSSRAQSNMKPVSVDGRVDFSEKSYIALPAFSAVRSNTGVAIHEIDDARLLDAVKDVGFSFVRTDLFWEQVQTNGVSPWHFAAFDILIDRLASRQLGALFILGNKHYFYSDNHPPVTDLQRALFGQYVYESAKHYRNASVRFEVWNEEDGEPNWHLLSPPPVYRRLLQVAISAAHEANPHVVMATGGVIGVNRDFIHAVGDILTAHQPGPDAVGVHPYRQNNPESALADYAALRQDLSAYQKPPAIWVTEWSYPSYGFNYVDDINNGHAPLARERQANYAVRCLLVDWIAQIPLSVYYDMRDDGPDPMNREHNFGLLDSNNVPLPAYVALKHLFAMTAGVKRAGYLIDFGKHDAILKMIAQDSVRYIIWATNSDGSIELDTSLLPPSATLTDLYGKALKSHGTLIVREEDGPVFIHIPVHE